MDTVNFWKKTYALNMDATPQKVWNAFVDTTRWKLWNPGVKSVQMEGDFITGSWFSMELPDGNIIRSQLIDVLAGNYFIDETWLGETMIRVEHRVQDTDAGQSQITYIISAQGPDAQASGEAASEDFPEVLAGLSAYLANQMV